MSDPADASTFNALPSGTLDRVSSYTQIEEFSLSGVSPSAYIAIRYSGGTSDYGSAYIDDIELTVQTSCIKPTGLTKGLVTANNAAFSWTKGGSETTWQYLCLPVATTLTDSHWTSATTVNTTPSATVTGLSAQTTYKFYVRAVCGGSDGNSNPISSEFTTPCTAISTFPWEYGFEGLTANTIPECWTRTPDDTNIGAVTSNYRSGSRALILYGGTSATIRTIILPQFSEPLSSLTIELYHKIDYPSASYGKLTIGYINTSGTFVALKTITPSTSYTKEEYTFPSSYADTPSKIALRFAGATSTSYNRYLYIDDIKITSAAAISCPIPTNLGAVAPTSTSATVTWLKGGSETKWNLQYSSNNGVSWTTKNLTTANVSIAGSNCSYTLTGLTEQTTYKVKVQADCGSDDLSEYTSDVTFKTPCAAITELPWSENFTSGINNTVMDCWNNSGSSSTTLGSSPEYIWGVYNYNSNKMLRMHNFSVQTGTAQINSPSIVLPASPAYKLTFDYAHNASCGAFKVKISTNGGSTFNEIGSYSKGSGSSYSDPGTFTKATIDLTSYAGNTIILQFFANANYGDGAIFIDNINIKPAVDCTKPTGVTVSNLSATGARLSWTAKEGVTSYAYRYVTHGSAVNWTGAPTTSNTYVNLTGLTTDQEYDFYVKCVCGGDASDARSFTPTCSAPGTPTFTVPTADGGHAAWTAASGVTRYQYCVVPKGSEPDWSGNQTTTNLYKDITGLAPATNYTFYVRSVCAAGIYSEPVSVTCRAAQTTTLRFYDDGELVYTVADAVLPYPVGSIKSTVESTTTHRFNACDGYTFAGWVKDAPIMDETNSVSLTSSVPATDDEFVDLYAVYSKTETYYAKVTNVENIKSKQGLIVAKYNEKYYLMTNTAVTGGSSTYPLAALQSTEVETTDDKIYSAVADQNIWSFSNGTVDGRWIITNKKYTSYYLYMNANNPDKLYYYFHPLYNTINDRGPSSIIINGGTGATTITASITKFGTAGLYFANSVAAGVIGSSAYTNMFIICGDASKSPEDYAKYNQGTLYIYTKSSSTVYRSRCNNYTVIFHACGDVCTQATVTNPIRTETNHNGVALPTVSNVSIACPAKWAFAGWSDQPIDEATVQPTFITSSPYIPYKNNKDIYAVYQRKLDVETLDNYWSSYPVCDPFTVYFYPGNGFIEGSQEAYAVTEESVGSGVTTPTPVPHAPCPIGTTIRMWYARGWSKTPCISQASAPADMIGLGSDYVPSVDGERIYAVYQQGSNALWSTYPICDNSTITLDAGDGKIKEGGVVKSYSKNEYTESFWNSGISLHSAQYPTTECNVWSFSGWSEIKITGGATIEPDMYAAGFTYHAKSIDADTLYAVYRRGTSPNYIWTSTPDCNPYGVILHANGRDITEGASFGAEATKEVFESTIGAGLTFAAGHVPTIGCPARWKFAGWHKGSPIERKYVEPAGLYKTGNLFKINEVGESFYAVYSHQNNGVADYWTSNPDCEPYTVKIHSCEGTLAGGESEAVYTETIAGGGVTLPTPSPLCTSRGWSFAGWVIGGELSTTTNIGGLTIYPAGTFVPMRNNLELYAVYSIHAYKEVQSLTDLNTDDKYAIAIFRDFGSSYTHTDFAVSNQQHSSKTHYLKLEPVNSYFDEQGIKYITNPSIHCQWKLCDKTTFAADVYGVSNAYKIKSVENNKYLTFDVFPYTAERNNDFSENGEYYLSTNSVAESGSHWKVTVSNGRVYSYRHSSISTQMSFEMNDVNMESFYTYMSEAAAASRIYRDMGNLYSSWPHCLEYTIYFDGCDGMSSQLSLTEANAGRGVTLPTVSDICTGWTFAGWASEPIYDKQEIPTNDLYTAGSNYVPERNNTTLYAVYYQTNNEFVKVNDLSEIFLGGNYVIVRGTTAVTNEYYKDNNGYEWGLKQTSVSISSNKINSPSANIVWTLDGLKHAYSIYNETADRYMNITGTESGRTSYARWTDSPFDNIDIKQSDYSSNVFMLKSNLTNAYITDGYSGFSVTTSVPTSSNHANYEFSIFRQKMTLWSYPCSKLVEPMRWGDGELIVESLNLSGAPTSGSLYITDIQPDEYGTYKITHTAKRGSRMRIKWGNYHYIMTVPYITTPTSVPSIGNEPTRNLVLLPNSEFVVDKDVTLNTVYVYEDSRLIIENGTLTVDTLVMRTEGDMTAPAIIIGASGSMVINSNIVYHDRRIADDRYYFFTLPFNSVLGDLRYSGLISPTPPAAPVYYTDYYLKGYDGLTRAMDARTGNLKSTYWTHVLAGSLASLANLYELHAGTGYIIGISDKADEHKKRILRFKLNAEGEWNNYERGSDDKVISVTPSAADKPANANHAGWNFIGNPYLHNYYSGTAEERSGLKTGRYVRDGGGQWVTASDNTQTIPYLTFYNPDIEDYYQTRADNAAVRPFSAVFVQIEHNDQLMFANPIETSIAPEYAPAYRHAPVTHDKTIYAGIKLTNEENEDSENYQQDEAGLVIANRYTTEYEIGGDLLKAGSSKILHVYTISGENLLAFNALDPQTAARQIPVGVTIPADGFYTFKFDDKQYNRKALERLYLTDNEEFITVDLLQEDYEFSIKQGVNNTRFAINAYVSEGKDTPTDIKTSDSNAPLCYETNNGITISNLNEPTDLTIYDMAGRMVYAAKGINNRVSISVASGVYNVVLRSQDNQSVLRCVVH